MNGFLSCPTLFHSSHLPSCFHDARVRLDSGDDRRWCPTTSSVVRQVKLGHARCQQVRTASHYSGWATAPLNELHLTELQVNRAPLRAQRVASSVFSQLCRPQDINSRESTRRSRLVQGCTCRRSGEGSVSRRRNRWRLKRSE